MTNEAKKARNEYAKRWRAKNPDKVKKINETYWAKKAKENEAESVVKSNEKRDSNR